MTIGIFFVISPRFSRQVVRGVFPAVGLEYVNPLVLPLLGIKFSHRVLHGPQEREGAEHVILETGYSMLMWEQAFIVSALVPPRHLLTVFDVLSP